MEEFRQFENKMLEAGLAPRTAAEYRKTAEKFAVDSGVAITEDDERLAEAVTRFALTRNILARYALRRWLEYNNKLSAYKLFVERHRKDWSANQRRRTNEAKKKYTVLTAGEIINKLIPALPFPFSLICQLQFDTGCRVTAVLSLSADRVTRDNEGHTIIRLVEKGDKIRVKYLHPKIASALLGYIEERKLDNMPERVFGAFGAAATLYHKYEAELRKVGESLFNKRITSHAIRRSYAQFLIERGVQLPAVQRALGHSAIQTTMIYAEGAGMGEKELLEMRSDLWGEPQRGV